ncbi:MAG: beta-glucosidase BglX [Pseudozobellia sp.]|nr:beta-glucosidase BglX [Pseudozobellia sp.]|tara:strand:+ start:88859 stop:91126 length:2268 start_codon:yes stop_codon:yes gene_type:complete
MNLIAKNLKYLIFFILFQATAQTEIPEVEALLAKMTLDEKIGQLNLLTPGGGIATGSVVSENVEAKIKAGQVGGLFGVSGPDKVRKAQEIALNHSRLKIPLLIGSDIIHGYKTTFPIPLGTSSSWDMELIKRMAQTAAKEATADGINWNFSPMVDISRDPRWGRIAESAGEDPFLGSAIAQAMIEGYQGNDLTNSATMMACVKHLALYGAVEAGKDYNSVDMSRTKMYNQYLPVYKAAVDAGVGTAMTSFNDIDGIPASGNKWLITDLLRKQWGFKGMVVSDYTSVNEMTAHGLGSLQDVSALAINAGLDMDMVGEGFLTTLKKSVEEGRVNEEQITNACRRVLTTKYQLGLLNDPYRYSDDDRPKKDILTEENKLLAREAAKKSFVLLKNHQRTLPLKKSAKVALIGPLANNKNNMLGTWAPTGDPQLSIPVLDGFKNIASGAITYSKGANITDDKELATLANVFGTRVEIDPSSPETLLDEALKTAKSAEVIVAVVGEASEFSGEAASRTDISLPKSQKNLLRELAKLSKPMVIVLMSGRPMTIEEENELPASILQVWHPGIEAGNAIAEVIYGEYNPSGKLTATWPRNVGQIPIYHSTKFTGRPAPKENNYQKFKSNYLDVDNSPLFPFGYGLSYTSFEYKNLRLDKKKVESDESVEVSVDVSNTGEFDGEETVQLYLRDVVRTITPPKRQLKGFKKVYLKKGETRTVQITLHADDLKFYNSELQHVAEPGNFEVFVGTDSNASLKADFELE